MDDFNTMPESNIFSTNGKRKGTGTGRIFLALIQHTVLKWCNNYFLHLLLSHSMLYLSGKKFLQNKIGSGCWWEGPTEIKSASTTEMLWQQLDVSLQLSGTCHVQRQQFSNAKQHLHRSGRMQ
jgi:hypothetical protein